MKKRIGVVTGTRAEYGLLKPILKRVEYSQEFELVLIVTGMHLSPEFGLTYQEIENDGFNISFCNEMLLSSDTPCGITKSLGVGTIGFADIFRQAKLDILILLGDRYEILSAAIAAMVYTIPIAHIHGGEITRGAIDDAIRHSITKMSTLHFVSTMDYRRRVIQLGEVPEYVHHVGALGVENIHSLKLRTREELENILGIDMERIIMVTFHPVTLERSTAEWQFKQLLEALGEMKGYHIIFTKANADTDGRIINKMIDDYVSTHKGYTYAFTSLGQLNYLSVLKYCSFVIGNSSSGIIEAPSFGVPTIDIGDRQKGRIAAESVLHISNLKEDIVSAISIVLSESFQTKAHKVKNPYEMENTSESIVSTIAEFLNSEITSKKEFYDLGEVKKN